MPEDISNAQRDARAARQRQRRRDAVAVLLRARECLFDELTDDILAHRDVLLQRSDPNGLFSFEFQEIEDRYGARIHAINSLLENLEYRQPRCAHKVETVTTTPQALKKDLDELVGRHDQWDLVNMDVTTVEDGKLLVVAAFTVDELDE